MSNETPAAEAAPTIDTAQALEAVISAASESQTAPEAAAATETPAAVEPAKEEAPKQDDKFAVKFAALGRKEKQLRTQEKALQQKMKEFESKMKEQEERLKPFMSLQDAASKDPSTLLENLKAAGLDEKTIIEKYILKQEPTAEEKQLTQLQQLQKQIEELKSDRQRERDEAQQKEVELRKRTEQQAKDNYLKHLGDFVTKNADNYELIRTNDAVDLVYEVMEEHYNLTEKENGKGELLTEKEAADKVEEFLFEQAKKLMEVNKLKSLVSSQQPTPEPKKGQSATLSNSAAQKVASQPEQFLSDAESKRRMASMIKFSS